MTAGLYRFYWDCGRMGDLDGLFIADSKDIAKALGQRVYFGEVLGKHSEIYGNLDDEDVELITEDPAVVDVFVKHNISSGFNPLEYLPEDFDEDEE